MSAALLEWIALLEIKSVLDAGCGDCNWQPEFPGYTGVDIVPEAIMAARKRHPTWDFRIADICADPVPVVDAVLCRDALQHMTPGEGVDALSNLQARTEARYLMAGTFADGRNDARMRTGGYYEPDLTQPPFQLGDPVALVPDGMWGDGLHYPSKFLGIFEL